MEDPVVS